MWPNAKDWQLLTVDKPLFAVLLSDDFVLEEVRTSKEKKATEAFVIVKIKNKKVKVKLETAEVNVMPLRISKQIETEGMHMRKTATKLCGKITGNANFVMLWIN